MPIWEIQYCLCMMAVIVYYIGTAEACGCNTGSQPNYNYVKLGKIRTNQIISNI